MSVSGGEESQHTVAMEMDEMEKRGNGSEVSAAIADGKARGLNDEGGGDAGDDDRVIDFVLVWNSKSDVATSESARSRRATFERNLEKEDLVLERLRPEEPSGLNFVLVSAPEAVLMRYAEILKLRLPMKKFEHIREIRVQDYRIPIFTGVYEGITSRLARFMRPFRYDESVFKKQKHELTAVFSRDKEYLFDTESPDLFTPSARSRIIEFVLKRKRLTEDSSDEFAFGIDKCLNDGVYAAAYPLHDGSIKSRGSTRRKLFREWASFSKILKLQPLDAVRDYYGVKIALYFAWLGFYTNLLIPPSVFGIVVFVYGLITRGTDIPSEDICAANETMICPPCDNFCDYWTLSETCLYSKIMYLFDNEATVVFAIFMSFWAALFLEFWKRYSSEIAHRWDVTGYQPEQEHPRPEYLAQLRNVEEKTVNFVTQTTEPKVPFWSRKFPGFVISVSTVLLMVFLGLAALIGVILYRMAMIVALNVVNEDTIKSNASLFITSTGACINLMCILIFNQIYGYVAVWLTELELNRTQTEFDESLSLKIYLLQFVNYYASILYIAIFKGKFIGYPGEYNRFFGFRQEECSPGGCFMELCLQMAIIFVGKQFVLNLVEYQLPRIWKLYNTFQVIAGFKTEDKTKYPQWIQDFKLVEWGHQGLFYEYLEMVIQYGFITIFVSAFPLAPLFALLNNVFELRLDAKKLLVHHRRPVAQRVKDIGIWLGILESLGRIAVLTNGFIIAFTSDFIPKAVYRMVYSPDGSLSGYTDFTLSYFDPHDFEHHRDHNHTAHPGPGDDLGDGPDGMAGDVPASHPFRCRYIDFRHPPDHEQEYQITEVFYHVLAARLAFVVVFQNFVGLSVMAIKMLIPNTPAELRERIRREDYLTNEIIIRTELLKARGKLQEAKRELSGESGDLLCMEEEGRALHSHGDSASSSCLRRRRSEMGDVTDGDIVA